MDSSSDSEPEIQATEPTEPTGEIPTGNPDPAKDAAPTPPSRRRMIFNRPQAVKPARKGFIFHLEFVFGVAVVLATLFTAWTPGRPNTLFPAALPTAIQAVLQPTPTFVPGAPTPTMVNLNRVGIVAGHWKHDSGAVCTLDGLKEVDLNLNIATMVQKILVEQGYQVDLLAEFDPRLAGYQAAALVSIHNDSCDFINDEASGFKVAAAFATKHPERAAQLTSCLRARYAAATNLPLHSTSVTPDMTSYHAFGEISENTPAAIIETGFMNRDKTLLTQDTDKVAQGVAAGILCYLQNENISPTQAAPPTSASATTTP